MKKLISLLLVLATVLSFAACGKSDSDGSNTGTASGDNNTTTSALTSDGTGSGTDGETVGTEEKTDSEGTETEGTGTEGTGTDLTDTSDGTESDDENAVDNSQSDNEEDNKDSETSGKKDDEDTTKSSGSSTKKPTSSTNKPASTSGGSTTTKTPAATSSKPAATTPAVTTTKPATTTPSVTTTKPVTTTAPTTTTNSGSSTPVTPSEPAPSYKLKGDTPTDPKADYNTQKIGVAALREGAGPLTENGIYIGTNEFMFIGETMDDYTGDNLWSDRKVEKFVTMMSDRSAWANENGIKFYFVIAPNKATVYGDYVPDTVTPADFTLCDQVVNALNANGTIEVVDLRSTLQSARSIYGDELFYKYDTHWNNHGGFVAYTEIMNRISADVSGTVKYSASDFNIKYYETYMKDMPYLLGFYDKYYDEGPVYSLKNGPDATLVARVTDTHNQGEFEFAYEWPNGYRDNLVYCEFNSKNTYAPDLYMYRDSFGIALVPFMKESFSNSSFDWDRAFYRSEILESGADVVVIEVVEKYLSEILKFKTFSD